MPRNRWNSFISIRKPLPKVKAFFARYPGRNYWAITATAATVFYAAGSYLGASLTIKNGARIIRPVMFLVVMLLLVKLVLDST